MDSAANCIGCFVWVSILGTVFMVGSSFFGYEPEPAGYSQGKANGCKKIYERGETIPQECQDIWWDHPEECPVNYRVGEYYPWDRYCPVVEDKWGPFR